MSVSLSPLDTDTLIEREEAQRSAIWVCVSEALRLPVFL
jgi:hypothetical protein